MTLQSSGAISMSELRTEFNKSGQTSMSDYYDIVDDVPASGALDMSDFYGRQRKGKLHAIGSFIGGSLSSSKSSGVSSTTYVASGDYRFNYSTSLSSAYNPCIHQGTDNRQSGYGYGTGVLFFYKYAYEQNTGSTRARHRYNAWRGGNNWSINHISMLSWAHFD